MVWLAEKASGRLAHRGAVLRLFPAAAARGARFFSRFFWRFFCSF
jgi:hypothetical protein